MTIITLLKPLITYTASSVINAGINKLTKSKKNKSTFIDQITVKNKLKSIDFKDNRAILSRLLIAFIFEKAVYYLVKGSIKLLEYMASKTKTKMDDAFVKTIAKEIYVIFDEKFKQK